MESIGIIILLTFGVFMLEVINETLNEIKKVLQKIAEE